LLKVGPNSLGSGCKPDPTPNTLEVMSTFPELIDKISSVATQHIWCSATQRSELNPELINKISGVTTQYIWRSTSLIAQLNPRYVDCKPDPIVMGWLSKPNLTPYGCDLGMVSMPHSIAVDLVAKSDPNSFWHENKKNNTPNNIFCLKNSKNNALMMLQCRS